MSSCLARTDFSDFSTSVFRGLTTGASVDSARERLPFRRSGIISRLDEPAALLLNPAQCELLKCSQPFTWTGFGYEVHIFVS